MLKDLGGHIPNYKIKRIIHEKYVMGDSEMNYLTCIPYFVLEDTLIISSDPRIHVSVSLSTPTNF